MKYFWFSVAFQLCFTTFVFANPPYPFQTIPGFEIASIEGYQESYNPGEEITFFVEGKSEHLEVGEQTGFLMSASMSQLPKKSRNLWRGKAEYDESRHGWQFTANAPTDGGNEYEIELFLYCNDDTPCAETYGRAAQIEKTILLHLR